MTRESPNSLLLHQYEQGELTGDERERVRQAIESDPEVRRRWQAVRAAESSFAVQSLPPWLVEETATRRPWWRRWLPVMAPVAGLVAVGAAVLLVVGLPGVGEAPETVGSLQEDVIRTKGALPELEVWVSGEAGARPLRDGEVLSEGSQVQLVFDAHGREYATLAGRDGTGSVEVYGTVPVGGQTGLVEAPFSLVLDDAPGPQTFFVLGHDAPLDEATVARHVQDGTGDLTEIVLDKE